MEFPTERSPSIGFRRGDDDGSGAAASPSPTKPSTQGGGVVDSSAQGPTGVVSSSDQGLVVPPDGSGVSGGDQREGGEEERVEEGGQGGGEVAASPLDDLNIQWTTSTSGSGDWRDASTSSSSEDAVEVLPSGLEGGDVVVGDEGGERVVATHPVEPSAQPVTTEEGRDVVVPMEEVVIVEEARSSEEERERVTGGEEGRERATGSEDGGVGGSGDDLKGKRVAIEEPMREQGPVGITLCDYGIHADPEVVAALAQEAPGVLGTVREEVDRHREADMATLRQAELEAEAEAEEWIREAELELRAWEELEVAQGPCVSVV